MATNNNDQTIMNSSDSVVCENMPLIISEIEQASSNIAAKKTLQESKEKERGYKLCSLAKAEQGNNLYKDILSFVTLGNLKKAQIIKKDIDSYIAKDSEIGNLIKESSKNIKTLEGKLSSAYHEVGKVIRNVKVNLKGYDPQKEKAAVIYHLEELEKNIKLVDTQGSSAYKGSIVIAGLQTYTNTSSLKSLAAELETKMMEFKADIEKNIVSTEKDIATSRNAIGTVVEELSTTIFEKNTSTTNHKALDSFKQFLCKENIDEIIKDLDKFNCSFDNDDSSTTGDDKGAKVQSTTEK